MGLFRRFKAFSEPAMLAAHRANWEATQVINNQKEADLGARKVNFINEHGHYGHRTTVQLLMQQAEQLTNIIYMLPVGYPTDTGDLKAQQEEIIEILDNLITDVEEHSGETFS